MIIDNLSETTKGKQIIQIGAKSLFGRQVWFLVDYINKLQLVSKEGETLDVNAVRVLKIKTKK